MTYNVLMGTLNPTHSLTHGGPRPTKEDEHPTGYWLMDFLDIPSTSSEIERNRSKPKLPLSRIPKLAADVMMKM